MELKEKVAYIKGLMEGMEYDVSTKEGKLMAAVVETLDMMAAKVEEIDTDVDQLFDEVDAVSEDLDAQAAAQSLRWIFPRTTPTAKRPAERKKRNKPFTRVKNGRAAFSGGLPAFFE